MSNGDRGIRSTSLTYAGPIFISFVIGVVCAFFIAILFESKASHDSYRGNASTTQSAQKQETCIEAASLFRICSKEQGESPEEAQRAKQDLNAQQEMADWAFYMLIASVTGVGISLAGFVFLFQTLIETRSTANAAVAANDLQRLSQRPWVDITLDDIGAFSAVPGGHTDAYIQVKNIGNFIARDCKYFLEFYVGGTAEYEIANRALLKRLQEWSYSSLTAIVGYDERHSDSILLSVENLTREASFGIAVAMRYRDYSGGTYYTTKNYLLIKNMSLMFKPNEVHFGVKLVHDMNRDVLI